MTQTLETLQAERENLAQQIKELDRQIKFVQNNVPKYDINHPDSPIHTLKQVCEHHNCTLSVQQTAITLDKEVYNNRVTRNRETTYPIDAQGYAFRISVSQNGETKTTVNHNIRLTKTIYGTTDDPITRNSLCHELKLFVRKYNVVTNDPPTVKILP